MGYPSLQKYPYWSFDTETTGLEYKKDEVFGFSVSTPDGKDYYYDVRESPKSKKWITDQAAKFQGKIVMHNASFDIRMSDHSNIFIDPEKCIDTVILACQINEHLFSYSLDDLAKRYLKKEKETTIYQAMADIFGGLATRNVQIGRISQAPSSIVGPYAKMDTRLTLELFEWQCSEIKRQGIESIVGFELDKMPTFIRTEMHGIRIDSDYAEKAQGKLTPIINKKQKQLDKIAGKSINPDSSQQIKAMFDPYETDEGWFTKDGVPVGTTPKGGPSIDAEILRGMDHPASKLILDLRSMHKMRDTFLGKHVLEHSVNGRVYPSINQSKGEDGGTGTGRLSYTGPALQQIPSRNKELAAIIKPAFLPDEGQVWVDCDMASFEVRVFAHLVENLEIYRIYKNDPEADFHQMVADLTGLVRNAEYSGQPNSKQLNLSMIFNSGNGAIAEKMGMPWYWDSFVPRGKMEKDRITYKKPGLEAKRIIDEYHRRLPGIKEFATSQKELAISQGYIETSVGRRLRFPRGYKAYKASGLKIQATAADINKENWKLIESSLENNGRLLLNTHDSYGMSIDEDWKPHYDRVRNALQRDRLNVPLILDWSGTGHNWHQALQKRDLS